jgi:hypothetical protein
MMVQTTKGVNMSENFMIYTLAGYNGRESERPAYPSSMVGMAFQCGVVCRKMGIFPQEIKPSRGYNWIVNRSYKFNFKDDDYNPIVKRL